MINSLAEGVSLLEGDYSIRTCTPLSHTAAIHNNTVDLNYQHLLAFYIGNTHTLQQLPCIPKSKKFINLI